MPSNDINAYRLAWRCAITIRPLCLYVLPFYLSLLHANFTSRKLDYDDAHSQRIAHAANTISDGQLKRLLIVPEWRSRLCAAWFVGLSQRSSFVERVGTLLLERELVFASQGYCLALGLIGGESCQNYLRDYLDKYPPSQGSCDQSWAIGALAHIQGAIPQEYVNPAYWSGAGASAVIERFADLVQYLHQHRMIAAK